MARRAGPRHGDADRRRELARHKRDPGRCYIRAGFRRAGFTKGGLHVLQMLPADMPEAEPVPGSQDVLFALEAS